MGNYNFRTVNFLQSPLDFPLTVSLGKNTPSFGLSRFKQGLRFVPPDDEGFTMRGDRRQLLYKGRRRSHRFTILGDCSFEYDCILLREPESNVITLRMEGAEYYDFFRQPDFLKEPFLAGSYAVYKKETLVGEGTGKLCHIHRPEIIDARGRRCWGDLAVLRNELRVTIPEKWLSEAKYPVVVDPTIGTTTVGSQYKWDADPPEPWVPLLFEVSMPVNRFLVSETINGLCTAFFYTNADDYEAGGRPVLYSDNGNVPQSRKSTEEAFIDLRVINGKPVGWRSGIFKSNGSIASGLYIWFGLLAEYFWFARFDYGAKCYIGGWDDIDNGIPNTFLLYSPNYYFDFRLSMYFTYTSAQNYMRTLVQGLNLTDSHSLTGSYKRTAEETATANSTLGKFETFIRECAMTVQSIVNTNRLPIFFRNVIEQIKITLYKAEKMSLSRKCADGVRANIDIKRIKTIFHSIQDGLKILDTQSFSVLFVRSVNDNAMVTGCFRHLGSFIRGLFVTAGNTMEMENKAEFNRLNSDSVKTEEKLYRGMLLFVRIVTQVFIRDYLLRRFLIAREELVLKSVVSREITLESKID